MRIFYLLVFIIIILGIFYDMYSSKIKIIANISFIFLLIILIIVLGLRWSFGDTLAYVWVYQSIGTGVKIDGYEEGFLYFMSILKNISTDPQFMIFITSAIITTINLIVLRIYSSSFMISTYLYITSGYLMVTMNGIRQCLAAAFIFLATILIEKKKLVLYCFVILIMSTIHVSALIMIPFYFIANIESWSKKFIILIVLAICGLLFYQDFEKLLFSLLSEKYASYQYLNEGGANILRILVSSVPVILSYMKRDYIKKNWKVGNIFVNMSLLNFIIMCFSYYNWVFARFYIYTQLYSIVLLTYLVTQCFNKKEKRILIYFLFVFYFVFFWFDCKMMNIHYVSNFLNI